MACAATPRLMEALCRLCNTRSELLRSHVIPEFLFRPLYDYKHRYSILSTGVEAQRFAQRGLSEKLLCFVWEQRLSQYEKYAAEVMTGRLCHRFLRQGSRLAIKGLDYHKFKLFLMSVLWRASVSKLEFFRLVSLGSREQILRELLLVDNPGLPEEFGCVVVFAHDGGEDITDTMFNPEPMRWAGRRMHTFFFGGASWLFHCDQRQPPVHLQKFFLQTNGTLLAMHGDFSEAQSQLRAAKYIARRAGFI